MSEKRFVCIDVGYGDDWYITDNGKRLSEMEIVDLLNELNDENEQLRKQIQNYEQLIANSYVGEEETLDGFVGKYVIWEDELQKYRKKIKKVMNDE